MKKRVVSFMVSCLIVFSLQATDPLLAIVIMVKNEADAIEKTLAPFAKAGVQHFFVFDTGSTDHTQEKVRQFFSTYHITHGILVEEPFIDFATSRNRALELAEQVFSTAVFMLMPDAEWYINDAPALLEFCELNKDTSDPNYWVTIHHIDLGDCRLQRLLRTQAHCRFKGVVHEYITSQSTQAVDSSIQFDWAPNDKGKAKTKKRLKRDIELLLQEYDKNPHEFHTVFFLAQCYEAIGNATQSRFFYERTLSLTQENDYIRWLIYYKLGLLIHYAGDDLWPRALDYYLKAYQANPHRAEPLIRIADHYSVKEQKELTHLFAKKAVEIPYPHDETFSIEPYLYNYVRYDLYGSVAGFFNEIQEGKWAIEQALIHNPNNSRLQKNLQWYKERNA